MVPQTLNILDRCDHEISTAVEISEALDTTTVIPPCQRVPFTMQNILSSVALVIIFVVALLATLIAYLLTKGARILLEQTYWEGLVARTASKHRSALASARFALSSIFFGHLIARKVNSNLVRLALRADEGFALFANSLSTLEPREISVRLV